MPQPYVTTAVCPDGTFHGAGWRADNTCIDISPPMSTRGRARRWALARIKEA